MLVVPHAPCQMVVGSSNLSSNLFRNCIINFCTQSDNREPNTDNNAFFEHTCPVHVTAMHRRKILLT